MNVKSFETNSPMFPRVVFEDDKPICFIAGPSVYLHLMRSLLDGDSEDSEVSESRGHTFVSRVDFDLRGKNYCLCGVLCDDQTFFLAVDKDHKFSPIDTRDCQRLLKEIDLGSGNVFPPLRGAEADEFFGESDLVERELKRFICSLKEDTARGDERPVYLFNCFDRLDDAVVILPYLDALASLGRQVFVSVGLDYPEEKMTHARLQVVRLNEWAQVAG